ncbi:MAG: SRPBCC domain-containing protein [Rhodocyclaceae bacterium]|nr:SRPBCC domain-containing protein [Rhodocyclaceae bacterium]
MRVLNLQRYFEAPPARLFEAFTDARHLAAWYGPDGIRVPSCSADARPGGHYRIDMHARQGDGLIVSGQFRELHRPRWISCTLARHPVGECGLETLVSIELAAQGTGAVLKLTQTGMRNAMECAMHEASWQAGFARLDGALSGHRRRSDPAPLLLGPPQSSHVHTACLAFVEKGVAFRHDTQLPRAPGCASTHPWCRLPCLESGSTRLFETMAIVKYVDNTFAGPPLMPVETIRASAARQWISAISTYFYDAIMVRHVLPHVVAQAGGVEADRALLASASPDISRCLSAVDVAYSIGTWLAGERISAADLLLAPLLYRLQATPGGAELMAPFLALRRAYGIMAERPSFAATAPQLPCLH